MGTMNTRRQRAESIKFLRNEVLSGRWLKDFNQACSEKNIGLLTVLSFNRFISTEMKEMVENKIKELKSEYVKKGG